MKQNGYLYDLTNRYIKKRITSIKNSKPTNKKHVNFNIIPKLSLPYSPGLYEKTSFFLNKFNIISIPNNNNTNNIIRRGKDRLQKNKTTNSVYKIYCQNCPASYVGQSKKMTGVIMKEHRSATDSVIAQHRINFEHDFDWDNFDIIDREPSLKKRLISEMIHINLQKNALNKKDDTMNLNSRYKLFFKN